MKKFSITQLEIARADPRKFAKLLEGAGSSTSHYGRSKFVRWQDAICKYHETGDVQLAIRSLQQSLSHRADTARNRKELSMLVSYLESYVGSHVSVGQIYLEKRKRIEIMLSDKLKVTGQIPIINMNLKGGYSVLFFVKKSTIWESELRFPVIQEYVASTLYGTDLSKVEVGVFGWDIKKHLQTSFSKDDVADALKELKKIGRTISLLIS